MSFQAVEWARKLPLPPNLKFMTMVIGSYADTDGGCFPSLTTLAHDTRQSIDTVRRQIAALENAGVAVRFSRWQAPDGNIVAAPRGERCPKGFRQTTDNIRLLLEVSAAEIEARFEARENEAQTAEPPLADCNPPLADCEAPPPSNMMPPPRSQPCVLPQEDSSEEDSPPNPPQAGGVCDPVDQPEEESQGKQASEAEESFRPFAQIYPSEVTDYPKAIAVWSALTDPERADAVRGARGYRSFMDAERRRGSKRAVKDCHRWLRDKLWLGYLDAGRKIESAQTMRTATSAEPEGRAWLALHAVVGAVMPFGFNREPDDKFQIPASLPPAVMAFADLVSVRGVPDKRSWGLAEAGTDQAAAWWRFFGDTIKRMPRIENIEGRRGFLVPWEWPPRKDGSITPTVDANELADFK